MVRFKDIHNGKRIWICGTGPSLLEVNQADITNDIIIACNSAILHFTDPDYLIFVDAAIQKREWFGKIKRNQVCINLNPVIKAPTARTINIFNHSNEWGEWVINDRHFSGNIPHRAVSFACLMGASEIILAGCDCSGGHPYDNIDEVDDFTIDIHLWKMMVENNPNLNIVSISEGTPISYQPYTELI